MDDQTVISLIDARIEQQNALAEKYADQVAQMQANLEANAESWLGLMAHVLEDSLENGVDALDARTVNDIVGFGFHCMRMGFLMALEGPESDKLAS